MKAAKEWLKENNCNDAFILTDGNKTLCTTSLAMQEFSNQQLAEFKEKLKSNVGIRTVIDGQYLRDLIDQL